MLHHVNGKEISFAIELEILYAHTFMKRIAGLGNSGVRKIVSGFLPTMLQTALCISQHRSAVTINQATLCLQSDRDTQI